MAFWFWRGCRRGVVTTRYPAAADPSARLLPTPPAFVLGRLDRDVAVQLVKVCPNGSLDWDGHDLVLDVGRCVGCGRCSAVAPEAVHPSGVFELAATESGQLIKRFPILRGQR